MTSQFFFIDWQMLVEPTLFLQIISRGIEPTIFPSLPSHLTTKPPYHSN